MEKVKENTGLKVFLLKYWLAIVLVLLISVSFFSVYISLFTALIFTFFIPGLISYRFFSLRSYESWALIPIISVLVSVQLIYYFSLAVGYSREVILLSFIVLTAIYFLVVFWKGEPFRLKSFLRIRQFRKTSIVLFTVILLVSLSVLIYSVWRGNQYGIVLTGSNWQDTPFHYDIIENLNQGNFPPQTPNYAGTSLTYHYFVDFHTAIIEKMYGYLPTLLPFLNGLFILVFAFAMYALARPYGNRTAVISTILAIFGWGLSYFGLLSALLNGTFNSTQNYIYQFGQLFGLPSIFDNLLQQRPLLVGLPVFALVLALLRDTSDQKRILLAGILTGLVFQFHSIAFFCCFLAYVLFLILNMRHFKWSYLYFLIPSVIALPFILSGGSSLTINVSSAFVAQFAQNPFIYYPLNLGVPLVLAILSFVKGGHEYFKVIFLLLFLIPNVLLLTPWVWDMYKFFIFAWIPIVVLGGIVLAKSRKIVVLTLVLLSIMTSASVIIYNVGTEYTAVSWNEYEVGLWIRENTPERSVFLTYYSIQCPPSMIGGRLRVSSYVYWPYGHGVSLNEVNAREQSIDRAYRGNVSELLAVVHKFNVNYVYVGSDELRNYPDCVGFFNDLDWLSTVYSKNNLWVYHIDL